MGAKFDWEIDDDEDQPKRRKAQATNDLRRRLGWAGLLALALVLGGFFVQRQLTRAERELKAEVQAILDLERGAMENGDGELFKSLQLPDDAWLSTRLQLHNQAVMRHGLRVQRVEADDLEVRAVLAWNEGEATYEQLAFFEFQGPQALKAPLRRGPGQEAFWGESRLIGRDWGRMQYWEADTDFRLAIAQFVDDVVAETCEKLCLEERFPLRIVIAPDGRPTARPDEIRLPSPRLVALEVTGQPGAPFWSALETAVVAHIVPANVTFAVPQAEVATYNLLARDFMATNPHVFVEVIAYEDASTIDSQAPLLRAVDGAALRPDIMTVSAGHIYDLTDLVRGDPSLDQADFYEQVWRGAWWHDRMWFLPQSAEMRLLSYDRAFYERAELAPPGLLWTWEELTENIQAVLGRRDDGYLRWGFLDISPHFLLAYAYNWENRCSAPFTAGCNTELNSMHLAAAFNWYKELVDGGLAPDVTDLTPAGRLSLQINVVGSPRRVATWVSQPVDYEYQSQLLPLGVVPFPGAPGFDGVTPLWVNGHVISAHSDVPLATWEWLKFLSYRRLSRSVRTVPARPSVAQLTGFWQTLPGPLGRAMHATFPYARPVLIEEEPLFSWERVGAVIREERTINQAARLPVVPHWFGADLGE